MSTFINPYVVQLGVGLYVLNLCMAVYLGIVEKFVQKQVVVLVGGTTLMLGMVCLMVYRTLRAMKADPYESTSDYLGGVNIDVKLIVYASIAASVIFTVVLLHFAFSVQTDLLLFTSIAASILIQICGIVVCHSEWYSLKNKDFNEYKAISEARL